MTDKKSKPPLLTSLLTLLLQEWGYDEVHKRLVALRAEQSGEDASNGSAGRKPAKDYRRPSAYETVQKLDLAASRREPLLALASRFDAKTFLPSSSDTRHFLELRGRDPGPIKQRQDSFRKVLDVLLTMSDEEINALRSSGTHAGPTQLGPLSDAIKATSAAVRLGEPSTDPATKEQLGQAAPEVADSDTPQERKDPAADNPEST